MSARLRKGGFFITKGSPANAAWAHSRVWPSGAAPITAWAAMAPLAPARFSTTTGCPQALDSERATRRAEMSDGPPGGVGRISVTAREGNVAAEAAVAGAAPAASETSGSSDSKARESAVRRGVMVILRWKVSPLGRC